MRMWRSRSRQEQSQPSKIERHTVRLTSGGALARSDKGQRGCHFSANAFPRVFPRFTADSAGQGQEAKPLQLNSFVISTRLEHHIRDLPTKSPTAGSAPN
jgi:hypothetical protein